jgi:hypothetical protein
MAIGKIVTSDYKRRETRYALMWENEALAVHLASFKYIHSERSAKCRTAKAAIRLSRPTVRSTALIRYRFMTCR